MPRPPRADEAGGLYHALNRGNLGATIFHKDADFEAFERILYEGLQIYQVELYSFQWMPNHYSGKPLLRLCDSSPSDGHFLDRDREKSANSRVQLSAIHSR